MARPAARGAPPARAHLLPPAALGRRPAVRLRRATHPEAARERLSALGFRDPHGALRHLEALTGGISRRAAIQRQLLPVMLGWFADEADPDAGLLAFRKISDELGSTHWYLRLLRDEGSAAERLAHTLAAAGSPPTCSRWYGVIWWNGLERLMNPFNAIGQVEGINYSGSVLVGRGHPKAWTHAYRFTSWDGHLEDLGVLRYPGDDSDVPGLLDGLATSDDSNVVVVGYNGYQPPTDAFIWKPETGMMRLKEYLTSKGISGHETWTLVNANCVSPNGKIIAGTGINNVAQRVEGFIVTLP